MSEIDVDRCPYLTGVVHCGYMECEMGEACDLDCEWYQLQKLKQENEELKKGVMLECPQCGETYLNKIGCDLYEEKQKYKQCIDEIEGIVNYGSVSYNNHKELADFYEDKIEEIIKLIKQAKEGK